MHFTGAVAYTILIASGSYAQSTTVQVVNVGASNGALTFNPNSIQAKTGDVVQFQFTSGNHSVAQAAFSAPCMPVAQTQPMAAGWWSGFMPMTANAKSTPVFSIMVQDTNPMYFYDAQGSNCQSGAVGAVNAPSSGAMTVAAFASAAKNAPQNMAPGESSSNAVSASSSSMASTMSTSTSAATTFPPTVTPTSNAAGRTFAGATKQSLTGAGIAGLVALFFL